MKHIVKFTCCLLLLTAFPAVAEVKIFACEPEWSALTRELGGDRVSVFTATTARQNPHHVEARPSLIARLRQADLLVCTGAELEIGWLPVLLRRAGNARVQPGQPGHFEAAAQVELLEVPATVDRSMGDVHASGNPHFHADPRRIERVAKPLAERLALIDPDNATHYRRQLELFTARWRQAIETWQRRGAALRGRRIVSHHRDWIYLFDWLGIEGAGTLEPRPGLPATVSHLAALRAELAVRPAAAVVRTPYQDPRPSVRIAEQTGIRAVVLPYTVGGSERAVDLFGLFDDTLDRLLAAVP